MKRKLYTKSYDMDILKEIDNGGGLFTAQEHAWSSEKQIGNTFLKTKDDLFCHLFRDLLQGNLGAYPPLQFFKEYVITNQYKNVLSLGSGSCLNEYLLKVSLPGDVTIVAADFDDYLIKKAGQFFPEIIPVTFDFCKDEVSDLENKLKLKFDIAVFFASAYIMDDFLFIKTFRRLKDSGVREIMDFHAGYIDLRSFITYLSTPLTKNNFVRKLFGKPLVGKNDCAGKFHGYARSRSELRSLYKRSGLKIIKELSIGNYKYVAILR